MKKIFIYMVLILFIFCINIRVNAGFPSSLTGLMNPSYCNNDACYMGPSSDQNTYKVATYSLGTLANLGMGTDRGFIGVSGNGKQDVLTIICTNHRKTTGVSIGGISSCTKITSSSSNGYWDDAVKAGVASVYRNVLSGTTVRTPKAFAQESNTRSCSLYYNAIKTITNFEYSKGIKDVNATVVDCVDQNWLDAANAEYNRVKNMGVDITNVQQTSDDTAFYVKVIISTSGGSSSLSTSFSSGGTAILAVYQNSGTYNGYYKILKSNLNEGTNNITVSVTSTYNTYTAENYDCGNYQQLSPIYYEPKSFTKNDTYSFALTKQSKGNLTINIVNNSTNKLILDANAKFTIHQGTGCTGTVVDTKSTSLGTTGRINLNAGTYSIKEVEPRIDSNRYSRVSSSDCVVSSVTVSSGGDVTKTVKYNPQCSVELDEIKSQYTNGSDSYINGLIALYKKHPSNTNLLNFSEPSCSVATCNNDLEIGCLSASSDSTFSENNLSCYDDPIQNAVGDYLGFCKTNFILTNNIGRSKFYSKSGRLLIEQDGGIIKIFEKNSPNELIEKQITSNYIATASTTKTCYTKGDISIDSSFKENYVYFGDNDDNGFPDELIADYSTPTIRTESVGTVFTKKTISRVTNYSLNEVYFEKMTGQYRSSYDSNLTTEAVYGVLTKFNSSSGSILFKINDILSDTCEYETDKEIIQYDKNSNGELELEFRTIDTTQPFTRTPKSNWNDGSNENDSNNTIINDYILNATNSYGIKNGTKQTPKYKITLTPDLIKSIRDYNNGTGEYEEAHPYDSYEVCVDTPSNECESSSAFIDYYIKQGVIQ